MKAATAGCNLLGAPCTGTQESEEGSKHSASGGRSQDVKVDLLTAVVRNAELCQALNIQAADAASEMLFCEGLSINFLFDQGISRIMVR
jgi:hypothetical protein